MINKILIGVAILFLATSSTQAKERKQSDIKPAFGKGSKTIGLSAGFGIGYGYYFDDVVQLPALNLTYDHGIIENVGPGTIGIGGIFSYKSAHYKYSFGNYKSKWTNYVIGVRATYHLTILKDKNNKFDPYAGIATGLRIYRYKDTYYNYLGYNPYNYGSVYPFAGIFVGAKYNFAKSMGAFAEFGRDISYIRLGLNFNF